VTATSSTDYRLAMGLCTATAAAGVVSSLWPAIDTPITLGLFAAAGTAVGAAVVRRELRIRRVLAGIRPLPAETTSDAVRAPAATSGNAREVA
jgi:hypothetical protein